MASTTTISGLTFTGLGVIGGAGANRGIKFWTATTSALVWAGTSAASAKGANTGASR